MTHATLFTIMKRLTAVLLAALFLVLAAPSADAKAPGPRDVRRAAHKLSCDIAGAESFYGPSNTGVICWAHKPGERLATPTDGAKTYVMHYRNASEAADYWRDFLGGQGCVAQKGKVVVVPADFTWYDCDLARKAAKRLHGRVIR